MTLPQERPRGSESYTEVLPRGLGVEDAVRRAFPCGSRQIKNLLTSHSLGGGLFLAPRGATVLQEILLGWGGEAGPPGAGEEGSLKNGKGPYQRRLAGREWGQSAARSLGKKDRQVRE